MRLPLEVGRAGLNLMMFIFVLAAMILFFGRPAPDSAAFVVTVIMLVGTVVTMTLLMIILRKTRRDHLRDRFDSRKRKHDD